MEANGSNPKKYPFSLTEVYDHDILGKRLRTQAKIWFISDPSR